MSNNELTEQELGDVIGGAATLIAERPANPPVPPVRPQALRRQRPQPGAQRAHEMTA